MNSLKNSLNFVGDPGIPLLNFEGGPGVPLLNFRGVPGPIFKLWGGSRVPGPGPTFTPCRILIGLMQISFFKLPHLISRF